MKGQSSFQLFLRLFNTTLLYASFGIGELSSSLVLFYVTTVLGSNTFPKQKYC